MKADYKNILIIRTDRLGDVICTTPALIALRQAFPRARLTLMVSPSNRDLLKGAPFLDKILTDDKSGSHKGLLGFLSLVQTVRQLRFDCVVNYHTKRRMNALCFLSGIPVRIGYRNNKFGFLLTHPVQDSRHSGDEHEAQYCINLLSVLNIAPQQELKPFVMIQADAKSRMRHWLAERQYDPNQPLLAIHPGASDPTKCWPEENFAGLISALQERINIQTVLIGSQSVAAAGRLIQSQLKSAAFNAIGQTDTTELTALLSFCQLLVSNDSGPVHVASALDVPVIALFLRNQPGINPERWKPLGNKAVVMKNKTGEEVFLGKDCAVEKGDRFSIQIEDVCAQVLKCLS